MALFPQGGHKNKNNSNNTNNNKAALDLNLSADMRAQTTALAPHSTTAASGELTLAFSVPRRERLSRKLTEFPDSLT